jgi:ribonucleoside-triphosphate reductase
METIHRNIKCRTRVIANVNGPNETGGRGNFAFVTLNLPKFALEAKRILQSSPESFTEEDLINKFYEIYDKYIKIAHDYLLYRLQIIADKHAYNFPFSVLQGVWMDSEKLEPTDTVREILKHATYSIGFCGLAECLIALRGQHHGLSKISQKLGLEIIQHLRDKTDEYVEKESMNWSTFSTPAETVAGRLQKINRKEYGLVEGVTDKPYMTNSFHVPVYCKIRAIDKINIEAPYHEMCNAGAISYIEMDGDPSQNLEAFETLVKAMHDANMGYYSINHPVDRDPVCGYTGIIKDECPHCHRKEHNKNKHIKVSR